jgi:hypothetical protein
MRYHSQPISRLFDDPDDHVNVLVNCSFELVEEDGSLRGWHVARGKAERVARDCGGHAMRLSGRVLSNRFEMGAHVPYEWTGEAKGRLTGLVHIIESDRYLRCERFEHNSDDWEPFRWSFLPPPNAERAECELVAEDALVDDLYLDGLGSRDYDILDSQAGYHPHGSKRVIVRSRKQVDGEIGWELFDTLRGRTYAEGTLEEAGQDIWSRWTWIADFSGCEREGYYLLRVHMPDRIVESGPIRIWNGVYENLAYLVAKYSYLQRCGVEIPGFHKPCHTNDALCRVTEQGERYGEVVEHRDVTGGWHDAGDYNKWFHYYGYVLEALALVHKRLNLPRSTYGDQVPDVLSEVFWGADFFLKVQNPDGSFIGPIHGWFTHEDPETGRKWNSNWAVFWEKPHEDSGGGEVWNPRSRNYDYTSHDSPVLVLDFATALATAARCARDTDDRRRWTYAKASLRSVSYIQNRSDWDISSNPYWVTLWYDLYRATDREEYFERANEMIPKILARQGEDGSFGRPSGLKHAFQPITVLLELLVDEPDHPLRGEILQAVERKIKWMEPHTTGEPYDLVLQCVDGTPPGKVTSRTFGRNAWIGNAAYAYALAGRVAGRMDWVHRAEEQITWLLGRNPHGICQVVDAGREHPGRYHGWTNWNENDLHGSLTGGIINGIQVVDDLYPQDNSPSWSTMPPLFPILSVRREDVPYSDHFLVNARHDTNEYWSLHHAAFHQAMSALAAAYADFAVSTRSRACFLYSNENGYGNAKRCDELFERCRWDVDRVASDTRYPHFDPRAYGAIVVDRSWRGGDFLDAESLGITVRHSFLLGVPWILLPPDDPACLEWLEEISSGLVPNGEIGRPQGDWATGEDGSSRNIHNSTVYLVEDEEGLGRLLDMLGNRRI